MLPAPAPSVRVLIFLLLPLVLIGGGLIAPLWDASRSASERERAHTIRMTIFMWMIGLLLLGAFIFMPNKARVLMLAPFFFGAVFLGKLWKGARKRAQRERELAEVDIHRIKQVKVRPAATVPRV